MQKQKESRFNQWVAKNLYLLFIAGHHEDYVSEEYGKLVITNANIWHSQALQNQRS